MRLSQRSEYTLVFIQSSAGKASLLYSSEHVDKNFWTGTVELEAYLLGHLVTEYLIKVANWGEMQIGRFICGISLHATVRSYVQ